MKRIITFSLLFMTGAIAGWILELFFRRFFSSSNPDRKWINPGFCVGPYLPLYGFGLCILYAAASLDAFSLIANPVWNKIVLLLVMAIGMTVIEYISGIISLKFYNVRLWDYSNKWGNVQGIICPEFSLIWAILGGMYYFLIHPHLRAAVRQFAGNWEVSYLLGIVWGVFLVDVVYSLELVSKIKKFAEDNNVIVRYANLKAHIRAFQDSSTKKYHFFFPFRSERPLMEHLKDMKATFEARVKDARKR